jgi:cytidine deaminase
LKDPDPYSLELKSHLSKEMQELLTQAAQASNHAYAPYSGLSVGASIRLVSGKIITGSNYENAAFPLCLCAERVALASAHAQHPGMKVIAMAVTWNYKEEKEGELLLPCGACRQVILETEQKQQSPIQLIIDAKDDKVLLINQIEDILPTGFKGSFLKY